MRKLAASLSRRDFAKKLHLIRDVFENMQDSLVALNEAELLVLKAVTLCKWAHETIPAFAQVVARHTGKEVMTDLHVQAPMQEFQTRVALHVHRSTNLAGRKGLVEP